MIAQQLTEFLEDHHVRYETLTHPTTYTAQGTAQSAHIPVKEFAKTVMIKMDGKMVMVVLPACYRVDLDLLKKTTGANKIELATELEFKKLFPECEIGAMPPFGNLYEMEVFCSPQLAKDNEIAFNAGSHTESIRISYKDFTELVSPTVTKLSNGDYN